MIKNQVKSRNPQALTFKMTLEHYKPSEREVRLADPGL